ncbi:proline racemase [Aspergillus udagawae]|nr:proline racemase [Aspergillus udagawae]
MPRPVVLDTPAGLVKTSAHIDNGKCVSVSFENVPAFLFGIWQIGFRDELVTVDIADGASSLPWFPRAILHDSHTRELLQLGAGIKKAIEKAIGSRHIPDPVHPDADKGIRGIGAVMLYDEIAHRAPIPQNALLHLSYLLDGSTKVRQALVLRPSWLP